MDGSTLIEALHSRSINVRYLGKLVALLASAPLQYLNRIAVIRTDSSMGETHFYLLHAGVCARVYTTLNCSNIKLQYLLNRYHRTELYKHIHFIGYGTDGRPIRGYQPFPEVFTVLGTNNTLAAKSGRG